MAGLNVRRAPRCGTQYRVAVGSTAAASSQLYVLSQAASLVPLIVNTQASPTTDIADFQVNGVNNVLIDKTGTLSVLGPRWTTSGDAATINLGAGGHYIKAVYGIGVQISACGWSPAAITIRDVCTGSAYDNRIGIGTTTPGAKLDVAGDINCTSLKIGTTTIGTCKLAVAGKIAAQEVIVTRATTWPDYVFKAGFDLKPLAEVEKQIKKDGHLEGIPTSAEVEKNGIPVGEMQSKLLQKVEELTLHMIEMEKENNDLKAKVCVLEKAINVK